MKKSEVVSSASLRSDDTLEARPASDGGLSANDDFVSNGKRGVGQSIEHRAALQLITKYKLPTPFVIISEREILTSLSWFKEHLPHTPLYYAIKANPTPSVLRLLLSQGAKFDVASDKEIDLALSVGATGESLLVSHPVKDFQTIKKMLSVKAAAFAVDDISELEKVAALRTDYSPEVFVRIRTESEDVQVDLNAKYGCRLSEAVPILEAAVKLGFTPRGLAFHVGTQSYLSKNFGTALDHCLVVCEQAKRRLGVTLKTINIGGGFCDREIATQHCTSVSKVLAETGKMVRDAEDRGYDTIAEPGRAIVAQAGSSVCQVIGLNKHHSVTRVHIDDGIYGSLAMQVFEQRKFIFEPLSRLGAIAPLSKENVEVKICGRTCDSLDMITGTHRLPSNIQVGDYLLVRNVGAYGTVNASPFNGFSAPPSISFRESELGIEFPELDEKIRFINQPDRELSHA